MNDYLPWQLMQPAASTTLLMEFLRWLSLWLLGVSALALALCLGCAALQYWSETRKRRHARLPVDDPVRRPLYFIAKRDLPNV